MGKQAEGTDQETTDLPEEPEERKLQESPASGEAEVKEAQPKITRHVLLVGPVSLQNPEGSFIAILEM